MKELARHIFEHALRESSISQAFAQHVSCEREVLRVREDLYNLDSYSRISVISIGKRYDLTATGRATGHHLAILVPECFKSPVCRLLVRVP